MCLEVFINILWEFLVTIKDRKIVKSFMTLIKELKGWILSNYGIEVHIEMFVPRKAI